MRILRFNESNGERRPKRASEEEFMEKRRDHKMEDFTKSERGKIISLLDARRLRSNMHYSMNPDLIEIFSNTTSTEIIKLSDYWFTINRSDRYGSSEYFICDDVEELYYFLEKEWY